MASGVPVISSRVGQAIDLIADGTNGWLTEIEDAEATAHWGKVVAEQSELRDLVIRAGLVTASQNSYDAQESLWQKFFSGFME